MQQLFEKQLELFDFFEDSDSHLLLIMDGQDNVIKANDYALSFFGISEGDMPFSLKEISFESEMLNLNASVEDGELGFYVIDHRSKPRYLKGFIKSIDELKVALLSDESIPKMRNDIFERITTEIRSVASDQSFFEVFSKAVAESFSVDVVLIGKYKESKGSINCPVFWNRSYLRNDVEYPIQNTPCEWVMSKGEEYFLEKDLQTSFPKDSDLKDLDVNSYFGMPLTNLDGAVIGHIALMAEKNIPERKLLNSVLSQFKDRLSFELERIDYQRRLEHVYDQFSFIAEKSSDIIAIAEPYGSFIYVSGSSKNVSGFESEELIGKYALELIHPDDVKLFQKEGGTAYFRKISRTHDHIQYRLQRPDGSYAWVESAITFSKGLYLTLTRDISERKKIEEALEDQRKFLRKVIDRAPNPISIKDLDGKYTLVNRSMADILGLNPEDVIGKMDNELPFGEKRIERFRKEDQQIIKTGESQSVALDSIKTEKGDIKSFQYIKQALLNQEGEIEQIMMVATDVTHRIEAEASLQLAKERAEELSKIKTNFLANMSHEIRTPINGILGLSELIESEFRSVQGLEQYTKLLKESGTRLLNTIVSILDFSKLGSEKIEPELSNFDLVDYLKRYLPSMRVLADKKKLYLHSEYAQEEIQIRFDQRVLSIILNNLIGNAVKFTKKGGVSLKCAKQMVKERDFVQIDIIDTGIGISDDFMPKIFSPFLQESEGFNREYGGTGLGLSIVKRYIELFGGFIKVQSKKSEGSQFSIFLPVNPTN